MPRALLLALLALAVAAPVAQAAKPVVRPGESVTFPFTDFAPGAAITITLQPTASLGGTCCGFVVKGRRTAAADGSAKLTWRWPLGYHRCAGATRCRYVLWRHRAEATISVCDTAEACVDIDVVVRRRR